MSLEIKGQDSPADRDRDQDREARLDQIVVQYVEAIRCGEVVDRGAWLARHPDFSAELGAFFEDYGRFGQVSEPLPPSAADACGLVGSRFGDYQILEQMARGGMGAVLRAHQVSVGRTVALKLVLGGRLASAEERERFLGEARAAARLDHPNIVRVLDVGEVDGRPYYTMPVFSGGSLAARIAEFPGDPRRAARLVSVVARAVHAAHEAGILHRDVKPSNILLDARGEPCLADFGLAKQEGSGRDLTRTGAVLGTVEYVAPELSRGDKAAPTAAADVYSLGAVLYELLTGSLPFRGATPLETLEKAVRDDAPVPRLAGRRISRDLETICLKCLEKEPRRRYTSALGLAEDLDRYLQGESILARPVPRWERLFKWVRRHPTRSSVLVVAVAGLLALSVLSLRHNSQLLRTLEHSRRHLYLSTTRLAYEAAGDGRLEEAGKMLDSVRPAPGDEDLRSFDWYALRKFAGARRWTLEHPAPIERVLYHPQRPVLTCAGREGTVHVWDLAAGRLAARIPVSKYAIEALAFSEDGKLLAAAGKTLRGAERTLPITVWDWETGDKVRELAEVPMHIIGLQFDAGGENLLVCSRGAMEVRSLASGTRVSDSIKRNSFTSFCTTGSRKLAAAAVSGTAEVILFDLESREPLPPFPMPANFASGLSVSQDGRWIACGLSPGQVLLRDLETKKDIPVPGLESVECLSFSQDGRYLAAGSKGTRGNGLLTIHQLPSGRLLSRVRAHPQTVLSAEFSSAGDFLATCGGGSEVQVWSLEALELNPRHDLGSAVNTLALSHDGASLAVADTKRFVSVLDPRSRTSSRRWRCGGRVYAMAFSPDDQLLACGGRSSVGIWSLTTGQRLGGLPGQHGTVRSLQFTPSGGQLAVGSLVEVNIWDAVNQKLIATLRQHAGRVSGIAFTPGGEEMITGGEDGRLVSTATGSWKKRYAVEVGSAVTALSLSRDATTVALACADGRVRVLDAESGRRIRDLAGHEGKVHTVAFSNDGKLIASAAADRTLRLWDARLGFERTIFNTVNILRHAAFGPKDELLVTGSYGRSAYFFHAPREEGSSTVVLKGPDPPVAERSQWTRIGTDDLLDTGADGSAWADFDGDGDSDVLTLHEGPPRLLRSDGRGAFQEAAAGILEQSGPMTCAAWGDADGDRDPDLYLGGGGAPSQLLLNEPGGFRDAALGILAPEKCRFAAWGDLDGDSDLDLITVNAERARIFRNDGGKPLAFSVIAPIELAGLKSSVTATVADFDADGDLDIFGGRGKSSPRFYLNEGSFQFRAAHEPFAWDKRLRRCVAWCDWDGDGDLDCQFALRALTDRPNNATMDEIVFYVNSGQGQFREAGGGLIQADDLVLGSTWGDFDLDGYPDLFVARDDGRSMLIRQGTEGFEVDRDSGLPEQVGSCITSAAWVDYDSDGDLDLFLTDNSLPCSLFRNDLNDAHQLTLRLAGRVPNTSAVGVTVSLHAGGRWQTRAVAAVESANSGHRLPLHFGLGKTATVDRIEVRWPRGGVQVLEEVPAAGVLDVKEDDSAISDLRIAMVQLGGTVVLDGRPAVSRRSSKEGPIRWEKVQGPPGDSIEDKRSLVTTAHFGAAGRYVYQFSSQEGEGQVTKPLLRVTVPVAPVGLRVHGEPARRIDLIEVPFAGDAAFDSSDPSLLHVTADAPLRPGGAVRSIRIGDPGPLPVGLAADNPGALVTSPSGEVWFALDPTRRQGTALCRLIAPPDSSPKREVVIQTFIGLEAAKPTAISVVPDGFPGGKVLPGDILIGLSQLDGDAPPAIGRYTPRSPVPDPKAYGVLVDAPGLRQNWKGLRLGAIDFAPDGSSVYLLPHGKGHFFELGPNFEMKRKAEPVGTSLTKLDTLAVNPRDGRIWVGDDVRDEIWSLDPKTFEARRELSFSKEGVEWGSGGAVDFPPPSMRFSRDGTRLVVSDRKGWVWVLEW